MFIVWNHRWETIKELIRYYNYRNSSHIKFKFIIHKLNTMNVILIKYSHWENMKVITRGNILKIISGSCYLKWNQSEGIIDHLNGVIKNMNIPHNFIKIRI